MRAKVLALLFSLLIVISALAVYGYNIYNRYNQTEALFEAIDRQDKQAVETAINRGARVNARKHMLYLPDLFMTNPTPLIAACKTGNQEIVSLLIESGADVNKKDNFSEKTPLLAALRSGGSNRFCIAMYLIEQGADVHASDVTSLSYEALYISEDDSDVVKRDSCIFVEYLLKNNVELTFRSQENALTYAAHYRNSDAVHFLVKNGYYTVDQKDPEGNTALIVAVKHGRTQVIKALIALGANPNCTDATGKSALDYAEEQQNDEIIILLNRAGDGVVS